MEVTGQHNAPADLTPGKKFRCPSKEEIWGWEMCITTFP